MTDAPREKLSIVAAGHVDHGKSTIIGRLLADTHSLPEGKLERVRAYCERNAKPFEYAFLLDALKDEQAQGITIDAARLFFRTPRREYLLIDAPGHVEFLKNMVSGAAHASAALLVIDAQEGVRENSRRHGYLLSMLGVRQVAVLINKMDLVGFDEAVFRRLADEYGAFLARLGVAAARFIPVSGLHGDNIAAPSPRMSWHRNGTVLSTLDSFAPEPSPVEQPFRMPVQDIYKFTAHGDSRRIVAGTIASGKLSAGDRVVFHPSGKASAVASIEGFPRAPSQTAVAGAAAGFTLAEQIYVRRGELAALEGQPAPRAASRVRASLFWLGRRPLAAAQDYVLKAGAARVGARLERVLRVVDAVTLEARENQDRVARHETADCVLALDAPIAFDLAEENVRTGRFVLVDDYEISGGGLIREALPDQAAWVRAKVLVRDAKWQRSSIPEARRRERYRQAPSLVIVTGPRESKRKDVAKALERRLFEEGRFTYFLAIGNVLYGVDADIRGEDENHEEDIRRLAEVAHILLDAGLVLIATASELRQEDLEIIRAAVDRERIETAWIDGAEPAEAAVERIHARLRARGFLSGDGPA